MIKRQSHDGKNRNFAKCFNQIYSSRCIERMHYFRLILIIVWSVFAGKDQNNGFLLMKIIYSSECN